MQYSQKILDHFHHPRNAGNFLQEREGVFIGRAGRRLLGDEIELQLKVVSGQIISARFKAYGGVATIACGSFATEQLVGLPMDKARKLNAEVIMKALDLPQVKRHAALLVEDALRVTLGTCARSLVHCGRAKYKQL